MEGLALLEELPLEVVEVISGYLSVQELSACCAASHTMRDLFGCDAVWRRRCDKDLAGYLSITPCKVQPPFVSPELEDSTLRPVSHWRMAFMRENHLWNNWRQGKQTQEEIRNKHSKESKHGSICHVFYKNDIVVALWKNEMQILDVREYPAADGTEAVRLLSLSYDLQLNIENDKVVIVNKSGVQVYRLDLEINQCFLHQVFFIEESDNLANCGLDKLREMFGRTRVRSSCKTVRVVTGSFFVGVIPGESTMHIWNLDTGLKLKEVTCPLKQSKFKAIKSSDTMILIISVDWKGSNVFLAYSLTKFAYLPFKVVFPANSLFSVHSDYVSIWSNNLIHIYNYQTSQTCLKAQPALPPPYCTEDHNIFPSHKYILKNNFLFIDDGVLKMFNPSTQELQLLPLKGVTWFEVLSSKYLQIEKDGNFEIWEFQGMMKGLKKTSLELRFPACRFFLNRASTRYIVRYGDVGYVIHFW